MALSRRLWRVAATEVQPVWRASIPFRPFSTQHEGEHIRMGPAVRMLLLANHLEASSIEATGPKGTLLKGDVLQYLEKHGKGEAPTVQKLELQSHKKSKSSEKEAPSAAPKGRRLRYSEITPTDTHFQRKEVPHFYTSIKCELDNMNSLIERVSKITSRQATVGDIVARAFLSSLATHGIGQGKESVNFVFRTEEGFVSSTLNNALYSDIQDIVDLASKADSSEKDAKALATIYRYEDMGPDVVFHTLPEQNKCALALGPVKKQVYLTEGSPQIKNIMEIGLSVDARAIRYDEAGRILKTVRDALSSYGSLGEGQGASQNISQ